MQKGGLSYKKDDKERAPMAIPTGEHTHPREAPGQQQNLVSGRRFLLALALILLLAATGGTLTFTIVHALNPAWMASVDFVVLVVAEVYASVIAALLIAFGGLGGIPLRLAFHYTGGRDLVLALGVLVLLKSVSILVYVLLSPILGSPQSSLLQELRLTTDLSRLSSADALAMGLIVIRACLLSPLAEELLFRGALFGWVRRRVPALPTILLVTVPFAAIHTYVPFSLQTQVPLFSNIFLGGIAVAWVRERTGSSLNTFVMHAVNNSLMLVVAYVLVAQQIAK
jgi:membrane protease YdiL (CAAX protease family)